MSQSLAKVIVHIVYSTKNRTQWLKDKDIRAELYAYNASILSKSMDSPVMLINGASDHIHIMCLLSRKFSIMDIIKKSKTETSKWLKRKSPELKDFRWQSGYGIFSVSESRSKSAKIYISNQEEHHKKHLYHIPGRIPRALQASWTVNR